MNSKIYPPLPRAEVIKAVERKSPARIPLIQAKWWGEGFANLHGQALQRFDKFPEDAAFAWIEPIQYSEMGLSWDLHTEGAHDARWILDDWENLDEFIDKLPDPNRSIQFEKLYPIAEQARKQDRYLILEN